MIKYNKVQLTLLYVRNLSGGSICIYVEECQTNHVWEDTTSLIITRLSSPNHSFPDFLFANVLLNLRAGGSCISWGVLPLSYMHVVPRSGGLERGVGRKRLFLFLVVCPLHVVWRMHVFSPTRLGSGGSWILIYLVTPPFPNNTYSSTLSIHRRL